MSPDQVRRAQGALKKHGYEIGAIDGDAGPKTFAGLLAFAAGRRISDDIRALAAPLSLHMPKYAIVGPYRIAHFLANTAHETQGFTRLLESTSYSDAARLDALFSAVRGYNDAVQLVRAGAVAIGNRIYANRNGNGDEASGDGYRYRGRGLMQHTGRANYAALIKATGKELLTAPQWLERPDVAALAACAYWDAQGLNLKADRNDARGVRRVINGDACLGLDTCTKTAARISALFV